MKKFFSLVLVIFQCVSVFAVEENFLLVNVDSGEIVLMKGNQIDERVTPCSTFKIALSLMGFDSGILQNEESPLWEFQDGYDDYFEFWKKPYTPQLWLKNSCVWFSRVLARNLGEERFQHYLSLLNYGNQDSSGGLTSCWLSSSLKMSPREHVVFIQKMLQGEFGISKDAVQITKKLLFIDELPNGWKLFGKTGSGWIDDEQKIGLFTGWIEKGDKFFTLAYNIQDNQVTLSQRIPRVKQLVAESDVTNR